MSAAKRTYRSEHGFTLIEVLIALGAMLFGFIALWGLHMSSLKVDFRSSAETRALYGAQSQIEQLRATAVTNFDDPSLTSGNDTFDGAFTRNWTVTPVSTWRKDVTVTVTWNERVTTGGGARVTVPRRVQLSTIITRLN